MKLNNTSGNAGIPSLMKYTYNTKNNLIKLLVKIKLGIISFSRQKRTQKGILNLTTNMKLDYEINNIKPLKNI